MKKINLTFILCFTLSVSFAQTKRFTKLREFYPIPANSDSLEKIVYSYKNEPLRYLQGLIRLEMSRESVSDKAGREFKTILTLSKKLEYPLGIAVYNLYQADNYLYKDGTKSYIYAQRALDYFKKTNDTTGLIKSIYKLYSLNIDEFFDERGDKGSAQQQLDRMGILGEQSSFIHDKIFVRRKQLYGKLMNGNAFPYKEQIVFFDNLYKLIQKIHPSERRLQLSIFYELKGTCLNRIGKSDEALPLIMKSVDYCDFCSPDYLSPTYNNIAMAYMGLNRKDKAEEYYKKNIDILKLYPDKISPIYIDAFGSYSALQNMKGNYKKAWEYRNIKDSLQRVYDEKIKTEDFVKLQTKYETEKKESTIKTLQLEKQVAESEKWGLIIGLVLLVVIVGIVSFLLLKLRKTNANLLTLQKARDKLYTIIAHDLRSPLNTYQRYSEIVGYLIKNKQFDRLDTTLKQIDEIGLHLASLLNNLLQWSLAQQKQVSFTPKNIHIRQFFDDLLPIYRDMAKLKSVVLIEDFADDDISTDPNTLSLIVRNLLDNAIKYTPEGEKVKIQTYSNEKEFILSLSNKGDTMAKAQKAKIKTLFETSQDFDFGEEGLGVGLILVKQYSKTNHAKVTFENDDDGHTTFKVVVPRLAA